jgi:hypothetical protein
MWPKRSASFSECPLLPTIAPHSQLILEEIANVFEVRLAGLFEMSGKHRRAKP